MKKFKYRMEALLRVKEHIERERQKEHALALHKALDQERRLGRLERSKAETLTGQRDRMAGSISVAEMLVFTRYLIRLKKEKLSGVAMLNALSKDVEKKRQALLAATKEKKIHEKLKEKKLGKFNKEVQLLETKENDEAALRSHRRKKK
jgi:flagellar FliJ protein